MIKIGLMGCGTVATYGHMPAIQQTAGLQLASLFDPDPQRLREAQTHFNVPLGFTDPETFMRSGLDAVVITSPAPVHLDNVLLAARHRRPVLCEKPLSMDESDGQAMIQAMHQAGVPLYVGFTYRFAPPALRIRQLIRDGAIGRVLSLRLIYLWDCHGKHHPRNAPDTLNDRRLGRMLEGGPMVDCGVHQIDLARWWLGSEIRRFSGVGAWVDAYDAPDHMYLHLDHDNGAHTLVEMSYSYAHTAAEQRPHFVYELIGTDGLIRYNRDAKLFEMLNRSGATPLPWDHEKNFEGMYAELARSLQTGQPGDLPTGQDGLLVTRIARQATEEAIRRRARSSVQLAQAV